MQIRFVSGLTAEEENEIAPALLGAVSTLLDRFRLAYTLRIETSGDQIYQHSQPTPASSASLTSAQKEQKERVRPRPAASPSGVGTHDS